MASERPEPVILCVGHDAFRAGAQISFLHILTWLRANYRAELSLTLQSGGALVDDFARVLPTTTLERPARLGHNASVVSRLRSKVERRVSARRQLVAPTGTDLIYANSVASAELAAGLGRASGVPVICHVHELEMSIRRFASGFDAATSHIDHYIAVAGAVKRNLVDNHGIPPERIHVVSEPTVVSSGPRPRPEPGTGLRAELGISAEAFVVGGCGTGDWRKGPELFLLIARALARRELGREVRFVWLGGDPEELERVHHDIARMGLGDIVHFIGPRPDAAACFPEMDVFLLTSREDPYPLVCIEAAAAGLPVVCFADSGGMPEFVETDAGFVVDYLDLGAATAALAELATSEPTRLVLGRRAAEKVHERNSVEVIGRQVAAALDHVLAQTQGSAT